MQTMFIRERLKYDGSQLRSLFAYLGYKMLGDSAVAWRGPCDISFDYMVDGEDLLEKSKVAGSDMIHFIVEKFNNPNLFLGVVLQRLFASIVMDYLRDACSDPQIRHDLFRSGDDLYIGERKLSISIATISPVSTLIHFAVNVSNKGTPVSTASLEDLKIDPEKFAAEILHNFSQEIATIDNATMKVKWVR